MYVLAHRGASRKAPENTLAAFQLAGELGADGVELDVHRTADDVLVVHHDAGVAGGGLIVESTFAALRARDRAIPTLAEVLDTVAPMRLVNIEMKCCSWDVDPDPDRVVARGVVAEVVRRELFASTVVSSFDLSMVDDLRALDRRIDTAWLVQGHDPAAAAAIAAEHGHGWLNPDWGHLRANLDDAVASARSFGVRLATWTVDDPETIRAFATAGVDVVITNEPDVALAALR